MYSPRPSSSSETRASFVDRLHRGSGHEVLLTGGAAEVDWTLLLLA